MQELTKLHVKELCESAACERDVCVKHLKRCKTSNRCFMIFYVLHNGLKTSSRGTQHFTGNASNEATSEMGYPAWPAGRTCISFISS